MDFMRIGEKLVSRDRIMQMVDKALEKRVAGSSQQEVANILGVDRSFVSRLETLGEIRKGGKIALVGFPIGNKQELQQIASQHGVDYCYLLTDAERWQLANESSGADIINEIMQIVAKVREYDTLIFIGSDMRIRFVEAMVDKQLIPINIGQSPIKQDCYVDPAKLSAILTDLQNQGC